VNRPGFGSSEALAVGFRPRLAAVTDRRVRDRLPPGRLHPPAAAGLLLDQPAVCLPRHPVAHRQRGPADRLGQAAAGPAPTGPVLLGLLLAIPGPHETLSLSTDPRLRRQSADLLRQPFVGDGWAWTVATVLDARVARVCCDSQRGRVGARSSDSQAARLGACVSTTCRCVAAARRRAVMVTERRQEVGKESVSLDVN
jgi:hypothetical protein